MIHVNFTGRCGNQLFQYAFARKLSILTGDSDLEFDFYNVLRWQKKTGELSFDDQLKHFCVLPYSSCTNGENKLETVASPKQKRAAKTDLFMRKVFIKLTGSDKVWLNINEPKLNLLGLYTHENEKTFPKNTKQEHKILKGYFENPAYFDDIKDLLKREFTPRYPEKDKNKKLYDIIKNSESVCVTFRKWGEVDENVKNKREVCGKDYYKKAIEEIKKRIENPVLIVFSDDIAWVKENFYFSGLTVYYEDGTDEIWEKLRMMYSCRHFVMTTSTFAWWAQYLCRNENKVVISPDRWDNTGDKNYLIDDNWIKI